MAKQYYVWMRSKPGMYEQYSGKVDVFANNEVDAIDKAHIKLKRTTFPDRNRSMWKVDKVECIG